MSIRSVDLQTLIPRSTDAAKSQQVREHGPQVTQEQFAQQFRDQVERKNQQVGTSPKAEGGRVTEGKKENKDRQGKRRAPGKPGAQVEDSAGRSPASAPSSASGPGSASSSVGKKLDIRV
ncbi:MAG: hypothetical protein M1598_09250 [Actinobacteria bacterium]|nr:hypothetical protein [Actinomycetota bacterium]